jgi:hypothetical protein
MNVLKIPKQIDKPLHYTYHARIRAEQRGVPIPNNIPFGAKCVHAELDENLKAKYILQYDYFGTMYQMVVTEDQRVLTVCLPHNQPALRKQREEQYNDYQQQIQHMKIGMPKVRVIKDKIVKYKNQEIQNGIEEYYDYV